MNRGLSGAVVGLLVVWGVGGCSGEKEKTGTSADAMDTGAVDGEAVDGRGSDGGPDGAVPLDLVEAETQGDLSDVTEAGDGADAMDVAEAETGALQGHWVQLPTGALGEHVLKSIWGFPDGNILAVGEAGLVAAHVKDTFATAYQDPSLNILNGVWGSSSSDVWTVGMYGLIYHYDGQSWGMPDYCLTSEDCSFSGTCLLAQCNSGKCIYSPTGFKECCGSIHYANNLDSGGAQFAVADLYQGTSDGGVTWSAASVFGPDGKPRFYSSPNALYFGIPGKQCAYDPSLFCPDYSNGKKVGSTATSPSVTIPQTAEKVTLSFQLQLDIEVSPLADQLKVRVLNSSKWEDVWTKADLAGNFPKKFAKIDVDMSKYIGKTVQFQFYFDSVTAENNGLEGIFIDDIFLTSTCSVAGALAGKFPTLWSVWGASPTQIFAVGSEGNVIYFDGISWQKQAGGEVHIPAAIHGPSTDDVVMVGKKGLVLHSKGSGWEKEAAPTTKDIARVWGTSPNRYLAVGPSATALAYDGKKWTTPGGVGLGDLNNVIGFSDSEYYVVADSGKIYKYDGIFFSQLPSPMLADFYGIWGESAADVMVVGDKAVFSGPVNSLQQQVVPIVTVWNTVWGTGVHRYVAGQYGKMLHFDGNKWEKMNSGVETNITDVWGFSTTDIYAVGEAATILHWDGTKWSKIPAIGPEEALFTDVWGPSPDEVYVVAQLEEFGYVLGWDGKSWKVAYSSTAATLRHVHGSSIDNVFAVGQGATIMRYNGKGWGLSLIDPVEMEDGSKYYVTQGLHGVWAGSEDNAWAVGEQGVIVHYDGKSFSLAGMFDSTLRAVYGISPENVWAVGNSGVILRFDGEAWNPEPSGTVATLHAIWGDPNHGIFAVGDNGTVLRFEEE